MIEFDTEKHEYKVEGKVKPSVTQILRGVNLSPRFDGISDVDMTWYMDRGTMVHKAMHHICDWTIKNRDKLAPPEASQILREYISSQDEVIRGYINSAMTFLGHALIEPEIRQTELPVYSESQDFCGTIDLIADVEFDGVEHKNAIIDFKCGQPNYVNAFQLAGYAMAFDPTDYRDRLRFGVYLDKKGREAKICPYKDIGDFQVFKSARYLYGKLEELNLVKKEKL